MRLLTWMHRKFRQGGTETLREFPLGEPLLDDHHIYQKKNQFTGTFRQTLQDGQPIRKSSTSLHEPSTFSSDLEGQKPSSEYVEYFDGFLAIGTLGTDQPLASEPETPTFAMSLEKLTERDQTVEATETELQLINDELERVFYAVDTWTDSSGRNSHVSNGRISHVSNSTSGRNSHVSNGRISHVSNSSTITLSAGMCPLQEFLLGSAAPELPSEKSPDQEKLPGKSPEKKEKRMSLGELFEKQKEEEEKMMIKRKSGEGGEKNGVNNLVKKILKKKNVHGSSFKRDEYSVIGRSKNGENSSAAETKLCKILHKFHKKVHPECLTSSEKSEKAQKMGTKDMIHCKMGYYKKHGHALPDDHQTFRNCYIKNCSNASKFVDDGSDSNGNRECWIKTDADYLVLEL